MDKETKQIKYRMKNDHYDIKPWAGTCDEINLAFASIGKKYYSEGVRVYLQRQVALREDGSGESQDIIGGMKCPFKMVQKKNLINLVLDEFEARGWDIRLHV